MSEPARRPVPDPAWRAHLDTAPWVVEWAAQLRCMAEHYLKYERPELVEDALRLARRIEAKRAEPIARREPPPKP